MLRRFLPDGCSKEANSGKNVASNGLAVSVVTRPALREKFAFTKSAQPLAIGPVMLSIRFSCKPTRSPSR